MATTIIEYINELPHCHVFLTLNYMRRPHFFLPSDSPLKNAHVNMYNFVVKRVVRSHIHRTKQYTISHIEITVYENFSLYTKCSEVKILGITFSLALKNYYNIL